MAGHTQKASSILARIGGADFAANTVAQISQSLTGITSSITGRCCSVLSCLPFWWGIGLAVFQQLCGINVVFNYAPRIFDSIGASQDDQLLQTVFIGAINLVFTLLAMLLVDKLGRKPLMLIGAGGLAVCMGLW
nr:MFS transporter [Pseudobacter ginsenosidimutans]